MITEINGDKVVVENKGKSAGTYLFSDFCDDELIKEKEMLFLGATLSKSSLETAHIYNLIAAINGELDNRVLDKLGHSDKYFDYATRLARSEAEKLKKDS